ncbi:MAG: dihydrodipicolinate synthase family protein [Verrucomicrobiales bacterium]|nr:dihydrodipicolinate synthase family protein [Verrucomicrobiales bacterium]
MQTEPITRENLAQTVIAVPPLARDANLNFCPEENEKIIRHIEQGGVSTLLYGGNANFYHIALSEYESILGHLADLAGENSLVIPAVGPAYGTMMDQATIFAQFDFPTVMALPQAGLTTPEGVETGLRHLAEKVNRPIVVYIKQDGFIEVENVKRLVDDGLVSWIKYATVRDDPSEDPYLRDLVENVNPDLIISGIGEQPAIVHLRDFGLVGFTAGCVCVRPDLSREMLRAIQAGDFERAEEIRTVFLPLENMRNGINPVRVLHDAIDLAEIAITGPALPLLSNLNHKQQAEVKAAAVALLNHE